MRKFISNKFLAVAFLVACCISCNIGKFYAKQRIGDFETTNQSLFSTDELLRESSDSLECLINKEIDLSDKKSNVQNSEKENADFISDSFDSKNDVKKRQVKTKSNSYLVKKNPVKFSLLKKPKEEGEAGSGVWPVILFSLCSALIIALLFFLVSWIFMPVLVALVIGLWTLLVVFGLVLIAVLAWIVWFFTEIFS